MTGKLATLALAGAMAAASGGLAFAQTAHSDWQGPDRQGARATHALNMLEYYEGGQFSNFRAAGANFTADVVKDGAVMHVLINPDTGQIQQIA